MLLLAKTVAQSFTSHSLAAVRRDDVLQAAFGIDAAQGPGFEIPLVAVRGLVHLQGALSPRAFLLERRRLAMAGLVPG